MSAGQALVMCGPVEKRVVNAQRDHVPPIFNRLENMVGESAVLEAMKEPFCHSTGVAEEEEIEFLAVVRPEIVEPEECAAPSEPNGKSAGVADWIKSAMTECKSNCGQPASCDEGPMCKCAGSCCAAQKECAEAGCLTEAKSIFALPGLQQPFTSQTIYVDPAAFTTPIDIPQRFMFDRNVEYEFQLPSSSGQFLPASIAPVRFTQPVVLPVDASTLK
jgi:hypothetical protein